MTNPESPNSPAQRYRLTELASRSRHGQDLCRNCRRLRSFDLSCKQKCPPRKRRAFFTVAEKIVRSRPKPAAAPTDHWSSKYRSCQSTNGCGELSFWP
ncbi:hypothetical protein [Pseudomonas sp. S2_A02]